MIDIFEFSNSCPNCGAHGPHHESDHAVLQSRYRCDACSYQWLAPASYETTSRINRKTPHVLDDRVEAYRQLPGIAPAQLEAWLAGRTAVEEFSDGTTHQAWEWTNADIAHLMLRLYGKDSSTYRLATPDSFAWLQVADRRSGDRRYRDALCPDGRRQVKTWTAAAVPEETSAGADRRFNDRSIVCDPSRILGYDTRVGEGTELDLDVFSELRETCISTLEKNRLESPSKISDQRSNARFIGPAISILVIAIVLVVVATYVFN